MPKAEVIEKRHQAALLLEAVIDERLEARVAINRWPDSGEEPDPSLEAALQALWHFEADEDKQQSELFYMDAQLELLNQMARLLARGEALPEYMHRAYPAQHRPRFYYARTYWQEVRRWLREWWMDMGRHWQTAMGLLELHLRQKPLRRG